MSYKINQLFNICKTLTENHAMTEDLHIIQWQTHFLNLTLVQQPIIKMIDFCRNIRNCYCGDYYVIKKIKCYWHYHNYYVML